jgi:hypothetical protein
MEIPRARRHGTQQWRHVGQVPRNEVAHAVLALPLAGHREQARAQQRRALAIAHSLPDDDVDAARLVFQGDEDDALGRFGLLAHRDDAAGPRTGAVLQHAELLRTLPAAACELVAQQRQWMAAQREAGARIVERDRFALGCLEQVGLLMRGLDDRRVDK